MTIDYDRLQAAIRENYAAMVIAVHGADGAKALESLLLSVSRLYRYIEAEQVRAPIVVCCPLPGRAASAFAQAGSHPRVLPSRDPSPLEFGIGGWLFEVDPGGWWNAWQLDGVDIAGLAQSAVVYIFERGRERIRAGNEERALDPFEETGTSVFARPIFKEVEAALDDFYKRFARLTSCSFLKPVWFDSKKLFFVAQPEDAMQESLYEYLLRRMGGNVEVRREQNVTALRPVDIKLTWIDLRRIAMIEIKWVGDSVNASGTMTTGYRDARAREGADQLVAYLTGNVPTVPLHVTKGYLVVFDGRRRGLQTGATDLPPADAWHYADQELTFNPRYEQLRSDFGAPVRMFMEPSIPRP